ncbi:MAG: thioredoxin family protein [Planctomycetia bacterium]|nr:thioredoxin family protein [Planctomycetia bacterium]
MLTEPTRDEVDQIMGPVVLEFGASWCPHCEAIQSTMAELRSRYTTIRHIPVEDGRGRRLGRSFRVKLWPTLIFLRDGRVIHELVRPSATEMARGFEMLHSGGHE